MKDTKYHKKMNALSDELKRATGAKPYDPDAYNLVITKINRVKPPWEQRRRRRPWAMYIAILCLLWILAWIVYEILLVLYTKGLQ